MNTDWDHILLTRYQNLEYEHGHLSPQLTHKNMPSAGQYSHFPSCLIVLYTASLRLNAFSISGRCLNSAPSQFRVSVGYFLQNLSNILSVSFLNLRPSPNPSDFISVFSLTIWDFFLYIPEICPWLERWKDITICHSRRSLGGTFIVLRVGSWKVTLIVGWEGV